MVCLDSRGRSADAHDRARLKGRRQFDIHDRAFTVLGAKSLIGGGVELVVKIAQLHQLVLQILNLTDECNFARVTSLKLSFKLQHASDFGVKV